MSIPSDSNTEAFDEQWLRAIRTRPDFEAAAAVMDEAAARIHRRRFRREICQCCGNRHLVLRESEDEKWRGLRAWFEFSR